MSLMSCIVCSKLYKIAFNAIYNYYNTLDHYINDM